MYLYVYVVDFQLFFAVGFWALLRPEVSVFQRGHFSLDPLCWIGNDWNFCEAIKGRSAAHASSAALPCLLDEHVFDQFFEQLVNG